MMARIFWRIRREGGDEPQPRTGIASAAQQRLRIDVVGAEAG